VVYSATSEAMTEATANARPRWQKLALGVLVAAGLIAFARVAGGYIPEFAEWVDTLGFWGPVVFVLAYASATVLFVPGALLTLAGGAIFGVIQGTVYVFVAASLGSAAAFLIARYGARGWVESKLARYPKFSAVDRAVAGNGLKITFLLRLSPIFPFNFLNYALGLTQVSFRSYVLASFGMLPGSLLYVYYGHVIGDLAALAGGAAPDRDAGYYAATIVGLVATIGVTLVVTRIARQALAGVEAADGPD
jgi:uncharacterized membrane protein YdjX (TVP38/TMEM64 family)